MFVRWRIKKSDATSPRWHGDLLIAQLIESKRIDGKPRQKVIAYLGSIHLNDINRARTRLTFWRSAQAAFRKAHLTNAQKHTIDGLLQTRVAKPTPEQVAIIDYLKENQSYVDQIPEHESYSDKRIYEVIKQFKQEQGIDEREEKWLASSIDEWAAMFPMAIRGTSGEEREKMLAMYKELTGKEYKA